MATNRPSILTVLVAVAALSGVASVVATTTAAAQEVPKAVTTASGLQIIDTKVGTGASPRPGQNCVVHYTGWLYQNGWGVPQDYVKARDWYEKAAEKDNATAIGNWDNVGTQDIQIVVLSTNTGSGVGTLTVTYAQGINLAS